MSQANNSIEEFYSSTFEDDEETDNQPTEDSLKCKSKADLNQFNEIQRSVQELISDGSSTSSTDSFSSAELKEDEEGTQCDEEDGDSDMSLVLNALEKSAGFPGRKSQNKTFTEDKIRDIERTNSILMKRILSHNRRANRFTPVPKGRKLSSSALNRKKQQKQIDHDNLILLRKIQTVKPFVMHH